MNLKKVLLPAALAVMLLLTLSGCGNNASSKSAADSKKEIAVGVTAGPHAEVMDFVKKEAAKQGLTIKVVEFNDYVQPNIALANKELDMDSMQHQPYLDNMVKDRGLKLVSIGKTILLPMALYSNNYKNLTTVPSGAKVTIPNDPTNGGRALLLLQQANLIKLKDGVDVKATVQDIVDNPQNLKFIELEAAQIPRSISDTDIACVNTNYAIAAGLNPLKDALLVEDKNSPYANVMVIREEDKNNETYKKVLAIYQSEPVKQFILDHFKGSILPAF
jgi:D-methionine transport system substrate-binding protein